jgi:hypothetical protein
MIYGILYEVIKHKASNQMMLIITIYLNLKFLKGSLSIANLLCFRLTICLTYLCFLKVYKQRL